MKSKLEDKILTIYLEGRIDSSNSNNVAEEIHEEINKYDFNDLILNAKDLEFLSSAGLRVVLSLKQSIGNVKIIKANQNVYETLDMTGFTEFMEVDRLYRKLSVNGCQIIGKGSKGTVYRYDSETVVKVYNNPDSLEAIQRERSLAREAFILGIPTAISYEIARVDGKFASVFELLDAQSYSQLIAENPENLDFYVKEYAKLLQKIHSTTVRPDSMPNYKTTVYAWIDTVKDILSQKVYKKVYSLIEATPDRDTMLHCDYHTNNLMRMNGETLIIDMDTLSHGHPIFDLANIYTTHVAFGEQSSEMVQNFLGYSCSLSNAFWDKFLAVYLNSTDTAYIKDVENKTKLMAYIRVLRHMIRRNEHETESGKQKLAYYVEKVNELAGQISSLDF